MGYIYAQHGSLGDTSGGLVDPDVFEQQGLNFTGNRPCIVWFRGDLYVIGYYTRPVVRHAGDSGYWRPAGIRPPKLFVSVVPGTSTGGSDGACLAAITFLHKAGLKVLAESNFSNVVDVGTLTGQGRSWTNIDNITGEMRVTHVRGYVSMEGSDFRCAWEAPYGVTGYEENIRTTQLTFAGPEGFDHGIPPTTRFGHSWAGRMWYANSSNHPYRIWFSLPGYPQYVNPASFRDTWDKEPITAIWKGRNELLVFCERACYMVRQFGEGLADFVLEKLDSDVGCISHFGISEIHNKLWFPSEDGIWIYDGSFKYLMKETQPLWKADYEANREEFRDGFALHDRVNKVYMWITNRPDREEYELTGLFPGSVVYAGYYGAFEPSLAGDQPHPEWTLDMQTRFLSSGYYDRNGELVFGACDGIIRTQDWTDGDDDGDTLQKAMIIRPGHQLFMEPGDDWEGGKKLLQLWTYVQSESTAWTLYCRGGDEFVWRSELPDNNLQGWKKDIAASVLTATRQIRRWDGVEQTLLMSYVRQTTHYFLPENVTGRGFTFELRATAPVGFEYRGLGGMWGPGPGSTRMIEDHTNFTLTGTVGTVANGLPGAAYPLASAFAGPWFFKATLAANYGAVTFPVSVVFTIETDQEDFSETVVLAGPGLTAETSGKTFTKPCTGTVVAVATDANNVSAATSVGTITLT